MSQYNVERFIKAQNKIGYGSYQCALSEIKTGKKKSHWIWYIFPQHVGLGMSEMNAIYGLKNLAEAREYYANDMLRNRLVEICTALYKLEKDDPTEIFGGLDACKVKSCCTLFQIVDSDNKIFELILQKYFHGERCQKTIELLTDDV